jgi:hypothetical protein
MFYGGIVMRSQITVFVISASFATIICSISFSGVMYAGNLNSAGQVCKNLDEVKELLKLKGSYSSDQIFRVIRSRALFLADNASVEFIEQTELRNSLLITAKRNGWSQSLSTSELASLAVSQERSERCKIMGISQSCSDDELNRAEDKASSEFCRFRKEYEKAMTSRLKRASESARSRAYLELVAKEEMLGKQATARRLDLPVTVSQSELERAEQARVHTMICREYSVPETTTVEQLRAIQDKSKDAEYMAIARSVFKIDKEETLPELQEKVRRLAIALGCSMAGSPHPHQNMSQTLTISDMLQVAVHPQITVQPVNGLVGSP